MAEKQKIERVIRHNSGEDEILDCFPYISMNMMKGL